MQEVDAQLIAQSTVIVDQREAAQVEAGELIIAAERGSWSWDCLYAELGALVNGHVPLPDHNGITYFKSCGLAIQDLAAASAALEVAEAEGLGQLIEMGPLTQSR